MDESKAAAPVTSRRRQFPTMGNPSTQEELFPIETTPERLF
jgi:hypothetical protein